LKRNAETESNGKKEILKLRGMVGKQTREMEEESKTHVEVVQSMTMEISALKDELERQRKEQTRALHAFVRASRNSIRNMKKFSSEEDEEDEEVNYAE